MDATPSWRFPNRWQRIHTAAAGMIAELTAAGIAAWIWASLPPGEASDIAFNIVLIAAVSTLLFNANPLMRFDGYFILTDLIAIPNLYAKGQQYIGYLGRRYLLGMPDDWSPGAGPAKDLFVRLYGVLALVWRLSVMVVILVAAGELFYGLGIVIALLGALALVAVPLWRLVTLMSRGKNGVRPSPRQYLPRLLLTGIGLTLVMSHLAWSSSMTVPVVVTYDDQEVVRVKTPGFIDAVHVHAGQSVKAGDPLVSLRNPKLEADIATLVSVYGEAQIRARRLLLTEDLPAYQAQQRELASLERKLQELELRRQELGLRAPREGRILARRLPDLAGTHVKTGFELMSVVDEGRKAIRMSVAAADFPLLTLNLGDQIAVSLPGRSGRMFHGRLRQTTPRATTRVEIPMFAVTNGGPLPVRPKTSVETGSVTQDGEHFEYLEPRVILETALDDIDSLALYAGEVGVARLPTAPRPLGDHALTALQDWLEHMLERRDDSL